MISDSEDPCALLVDDEPSILSALTMLLGAVGWETSRAITAEEALKQSAEKHFSVAIIDFKMPKMNGFELSRKIRAQSQNENLIIFLHSGYIEPEYIATMESSGANAVIWKPAGLAEIKEIFIKYGLPVKS